MTNFQNYYSTLLIYLLVSSGLLLLAFSLVHASEIQVKKFEKQVYSSVISKDDAVFKYNDFLNFLCKPGHDKKSIQISRIFTTDWAKGLDEIKSGNLTSVKLKEKRNSVEEKVIEERIKPLSQKLYKTEDGEGIHDLNLKTTNLVGKNLSQLHQLITYEYLGMMSLSEYKRKKREKNNRHKAGSTTQEQSSNSSLMDSLVIHTYLSVNLVYFAFSILLGGVMFLGLLVANRIYDYFFDQVIFSVSYLKFQLAISILFLMYGNGRIVFSWIY